MVTRFLDICEMNKRLLFVYILVTLNVNVFAQTILLKDLKGKSVSVNLLADKNMKILFFLSPECPLCQSYSLTIRNLYDQYAKNGVEMVGIIPGSDFSDETILNYKNTYHIPIQLYTDEQLVTIKKYHATITPEVVMLDIKGNVLYQGRIDNWAYALGKKRTVITEHNLEDAIKSVLHKQPIKVPKTAAIGCYIE